MHENHAVSMKNIVKRFGPLVVNDKVNFDVKPGTIHGLLGENGAGKSTLMNILYGLYQPDSGEIFIHGRQEQIDTPSKAISLGIGMVHQHFMLVRPFTVAENVVLGFETKGMGVVDLKKAREKILTLGEQYHLKVDPDAKISTLSVGEQQRVEILSVVYYGADILILDEPTAVLTPQEVRELFQILNLMRESGKSIIFISHKLEEVLEICDEVSVLRDGKKIGTVPAKHVTKKELTRMMVGREVLFDFTAVDRSPGQVVMEVEKVSALSDKGLPALQEVSLQLREGEILGIAGVDGNGQKELCEVLTGLRPVTRGRIQLKGRDLSQGRPKDFIRAGVSHVPEDRHSLGLAMNMNVMQNFIIKEFDTPRYCQWGMLRGNRIKEECLEMVRQYDVKTSSIYARVRLLSGGNQQKIVLGREIGCNPSVIIVNQPTRGLDIGATEYVRQQLLDQKEKGVAILLVSADLDEVLQLSDRIAVIYEGRIMGVLEKGEFDIERIGLMMAGVGEVAV
ncbi:MAG TPA: ABC transporter ATP-binding protein [Clostridia bacterium]|nr:ABC transporter ATP-binding protein [Clostridia bacterium]